MRGHTSERFGAHAVRVLIWTSCLIGLPETARAINADAYRAFTESMQRNEERQRDQQLHDLEVERRRLQLEIQQLQLQRMRQQMEQKCETYRRVDPLTGRESLQQVCR